MSELENSRGDTYFLWSKLILSWFPLLITFDQVTGQSLRANKEINHKISKRKQKTLLCHDSTQHDKTYLGLSEVWIYCINLDDKGQMLIPPKFPLTFSSFFLSFSESSTASALVA